MQAQGFAALTYIRYEVSTVIFPLKIAMLARDVFPRLYQHNTSFFYIFVFQFGKFLMIIFSKIVYGKLQLVYWDKNNGYKFGFIV